MPEKYWLVENVYTNEHQEYYNRVVMIDQHESVVRSEMNSRVEHLMKCGYTIYGDEDTAVLKDDTFEVTFYILKEVTHFPK